MHLHENMANAKKEPRKQGPKKKNPHAVALGKRGGRKGGVARAKAMAPEERKASAKKAADARWSIPRATHAGELRIADLVLPCANLPDGRRVLTEKAMMDALERGYSGYYSRRDAQAKSSTAVLPRYLAPAALRPFISRDLMDLQLEPIRFLPLNGKTPAKGFNAELLPRVCDVWLKARAAGVLNEAQLRTAAKAEVIVSGLAITGIIALIDEATGYQYDRARNELQVILKAYISEKLMPWTRMFSNEFFREVYKIHGYEFSEGSAKRPGYIGHFIKRYVYGALPPGVIEELERKNPTVAPGRRRHKHFQFLTEDTGNPELDKQIVRVTTLLQISADKNDFKAHFKRACPKKGDQFDINFPREEE